MFSTTASRGKAGLHRWRFFPCYMDGLTTISSVFLLGAAGCGKEQDQVLLVQLFILHHGDGR
jgi:hypothetical protein